MRVAIVILGLLFTGCVQSGVTTCADDRLCPSGTVCDEDHGTCVVPSQLVDCVGLEDGHVCAISGSAAVCRDQLCVHPFCGDGIKDPGELCDGTDLGASTCLDAGYYDPEGLACTTACTYETSRCEHTCGDNIVDDAEVCDGAPPEERRCTRFGFDAGALGCSNATCGPDFSTCKTIGWNDTQVDGPFYSVWAAGPDDIYAVGAVFLHWNGAKWNPVDAGVTAPSFVWGTSASDVYVVGSDEVAHFDGSTWAKTAFPGGVILGVGGSGPADVYVAGWGGLFHGSGTTFTRVAAFDATGISAQRVWGSSPNDIYAGGKAGLSHWNGATWTTQFLNTSIFEGDLNFGGIWGTSATDIFAITHKAIFHSDGVTWTRMAMPYSTNLTGIHGRASNDVFVSTGNGVLHYDGHTWSAMPILEGAYSVFEIAPDRVIGGSTSILEFHGDAPVTAHLTTKLGLQAIAKHSTTEIHAVGDAGIALGFDGTRWRVESTPTDLALHDVWDRFAVGDGGTILNWTGTRWVAMDSSTTETLRGVWGASANLVYAIGDAGVVRKYTGTTWTSVTLPNIGIPPANLTAITGKSATDIYILAESSLVFHWNGTAWASVELGSTARLNDIGIAPDGQIWLVGDRGTIYRGTNLVFAKFTSNESADLLSIGGDPAKGLLIAMRDRFLRWNGTALSALVSGEGLSPAPAITAWAPNADYGVGPELAVISAVEPFQDPWIEEVSPTTIQGFDRVLAVGPGDIYTIRYPGVLFHFDGAITSRVGVHDNQQATTMTGSASDDVYVGLFDDLYHYDGTAWTAVASPPTFAIAGLHARTSTDIWAVGAGGATAHYDGSTWTPRSAPFEDLVSVWTASASSAFAGTRDGAILRWDGSSWAESEPGDGFGQFTRFWGSSPTDVYANGNEHTLHWDGTAWTRIFDHSTGVTGSSATDVFVAASHVQHFDGEVWTPVRDLFDGLVDDVAIAGDTIWMRQFSGAGIRLVGLRRLQAW